tara:strand:+ start:100 stop:396 length:297 start_codon:yes stop_codon:yes gene_type:complete
MWLELVKKIVFFMYCLIACDSNNGSHHLYLKVDKITCHGCISAISARLHKIDGVQKVTGDPQQKTVHVVLNKKVAESSISSALKEIDYGATKISTKAL